MNEVGKMKISTSARSQARGPGQASVLRRRVVPADYYLWRDKADANAAALATSDSVSGHPSVCTVYVRVRGENIVFFGNSRSGKVLQLQWNPYAGLCFFWRYFQKQITVEGIAEVLDRAVADDYWDRRPRESKLGARASRPHL